MNDNTNPAATSGDAPADSFTQEQVIAAARVLSDRSATACSVNKLDNWDIYGGEFIDDARAALEAAAVSAATKPTADLPDENECWVHIYPSDLKRMERTETHATVFSVAVGRAGEVSVPLYTAEQVQSLLATKPAAGVPMDELMTFAKYRLGLDLHGQTFADLVGLFDAASTIGAAQTADQVRDALNFAANVIELFDDKTMEGDYMLDAGECAGIIRALPEYLALKRPTTTYNSEAGATQTTEGAGNVG